MLKADYSQVHGDVEFKGKCLDVLLCPSRGRLCDQRNRAGVVPDHGDALGGSADTCAGVRPGQKPVCPAAGHAQVIPTPAPAQHPQLKGAQLGWVVYAIRRGAGQKKVLLIAHMDTVYLKGMAAKQPFRIDGNKAYGLAIADDKAGVALILHTEEYIFIDSIAPRLYLSTRMVMDIGSGKVRW